jgi:UDP-GlcNAc3NAcA epimerase
MRWVSVVGARPQFVKIAPVSRAIAAHNAAGGTPVDDLIVHTGQHYDSGMSDVFFSELEIPAPGVRLGVGSGTHGVQTARMLEGIEALLLERKPDVVVVYGDTNSTIAGALAAVKLHIPLAHVEAGLRSFNRRMPEEVNRVATDHLSDLLLAPTATAMKNLETEGLAAKAQWCGDVMCDAVLYNVVLARRQSRILETLGLTALGYGVVTIHRAESTEGPVLREILATLDEVARGSLPLVFPVHPRTRRMIEDPAFGWRPSPQLRLVEPLGYLDMLRLVEGARIVLTDSGGLQKEAFFLGRPCVTLRTETEWVETVSAGANVVVGLDRAAILAAVRRWLGGPPPSLEVDAVRPEVAQHFGAGDTARRIVDAIVGQFGGQRK